MNNFKPRAALTETVKTLFLAGLVSHAIPSWAVEKGSSDELQFVKPLMEELLPFLPPEPQVRNALLAHPKVREARLMANTKQIEADITRSSPYEWEAGVSFRNRKDRTVMAGSDSSMDQEINLSRSIRLPGKQRIKDRQSVSVQLLGETLYGDSLHEASLSLGQNWLECQRLESRADLFDSLGDELKRFSAQQAKRLKAGEVSKVEATQAELALQQIQIEKALNDKQLRSVKSVIQLEFPALLNAQSKRQCGEPALSKHSNDSAHSGPNYLSTEMNMDLAAQNKWVETMVKMSHPLSIRRIETDILRDHSQLSKADMLPDPKVGLSYAMERDNAEQILGLHVSMPLGGAVRRNQSRLSGSELAHSEVVLKSLAQQTEAQAAQNVLNWQQSRQAAVLSLNQARFSWTLLKSLEKAYLLGESTATELTLARQQSHRSRMEAIDSSYSALQAQAQMLINAHQAWDLD